MARDKRTPCKKEFVVPKKEPKVKAEASESRRGSGAPREAEGAESQPKSAPSDSQDHAPSAASRHGGGAEVVEKRRLGMPAPRASEGTVIKQANAFRRDYRAPGPLVRIAPMQIGFHPENRGGQAPSGERCNALLKDILAVGFDCVEADTNGVLLGETPGKTGILYFNQKACAGEDNMAPIAVKTMPYGSLSHSHLNQVLKNVLQGVESDAPNITGPDGRLSLDLLRSRDPEFAKACTDGLLWEILDPAMLLDHPDSANIIQLALNSKNKIHMAQHEMEVLSQLWRICDQASSVGDRLSLQQARRELRKVMPQMSDDDEVKAAFRFVVDMGGNSAPFLQDLQDFHGKHVDPQVRELLRRFFS